VEISFSRYRIYRECPWKYKLQFLEGRRPPMDPSSSLGLTLHRALERYHRAGEPEWRALADAFDLEFLRSGYPDASTRAQWSQKGIRILKKYFESELSRRTEVVGSEREFFFPLGKHTVRGMIDRIDRHPDGRLEIIDYKTRFGLGPNDPAPGPEAADLQLRFYALGCKEGLRCEPALLSVHYLAAGRVETRPYDASKEEALKADIVAVADAIEAGRFGPETSFCRRCGFRNDCAFSVARDA
jgi:DNA helicase-2/ATP-dependent DNA helicase PcrA